MQQFFTRLQTHSRLCSLSVKRSCLPPVVFSQHWLAPSHLSLISRKKMSSASRLSEDTLRISAKIDAMLQWLESLPVSSSSSPKSEAMEQTCAYPELGDKFYLTTAINYTNGPPHIGHAYEAVVSDIVARYHRAYGRQVFFLTGTDEHGQKIADTAAAKGLAKAKDLCDLHVPVFQRLNAQLRISNDHFVRTTHDYHYALAQEMFARSKANGDIYLSEYSGWYNPREEEFVKETEAKLSDYKDAVTGKPLERKCEAAYFFRMSNYQTKLVEHFTANPQFLLPKNEYNSIVYRLKHESLEDLCVSRSTMKWGVPVPGDEGHVLYVWFDALSNYLSGIDYFGKNEGTEDGSGTQSIGKGHFWPCDCHVIGKDIKWFHTVIWPCLLMSCGIPLPKAVFCHGFVTDANGVKMSKSVGNVVDPFQMLERHSADSLRYFIATQGTFGDDMRWSEKDLRSRHDAHLTKTFGNLVNRVLVLTKKLCKSKVPPLNADGSDDEEKTDDCIIATSTVVSDKTHGVDNVIDVDSLRRKVECAFAQYNFADAADLTMQSFRDCNDYLTKSEPWKRKATAPRVMRTALECIYVLAHFMWPFTPRACEQIFADLKTDKVAIRNLRADLRNLKARTKVNVGDVLFKQHITKFEKAKLTADMPVIAKVDFRVGRVVKVELHPTNEALFVEQIDIGEAKHRQVVSGLAQHISKEQLEGSLVVVFANLKESKFRGVLSQGMVLCAADGSRTLPLSVASGTPVGERVNWSKKDLFQYKALEVGVRIKRKGKSFWEKEIGPVIATNASGEAQWNEGLFVTSKGPVFSTLKDAKIC